MPATLLISFISGLLTDDKVGVKRVNLKIK